jgi:membrane protease YdiL (CAAX protease family)
VIDERLGLKPLGWKPSLLIFLVTALILRLTHYVLIPAFKSITGTPYLIGYLIGWVGTMSLIFLASLAAYRLEGNPIRWYAFSTRYRLRPLKRVDWLWTVGMFLFAGIGAMGLSFVQTRLITIPLFAPHPAFPSEFIDPYKIQPGYLFEMPLKGEWWIIFMYFLGWFLNIFGEEFWYRGWMLPRQELAFGKYAWLVNGLMFNFQHIYMPWNLIAMLPGSLFVSYAVQRQKKTWMSILWHGSLNILLLVYVIQGVVLS